ncbi:uncharacterized protein OCT59_024301 [Rhizophagus irregularis]|uniref:Rad53p n=2 Tax=Rhizophagus irregularis TaxID=588596 RepID=A0A015JI34_RHIIW|nr:kinase-like domain-containing protein [Rhizophagus irregularis DAOM 181602=DAOM 197198]EXX54579.1 Rad53p [Rhizophagus irregularis DAOM 197198w]POG75309.1 kinase-like domain-containing protein [Rhizophagus irregularis DAOM 181602=DAOM 197198]UZO03901.1 hypothetical protein OCT59_024301 [Rhizophagus irregularis]GBC22526.1 kinase-like domain-containing protein [Rhizophagus irregularis DAOM 181602=DAOM 197198]|eukprot:XP_025182175.1 kinase-like domain-containing protein [Rhizophagus irregularis DAOM 181602=DAOM 197198]
MSNNIEIKVTKNSDEQINWIEDAISKNYFKYYEYNHFRNIQEIGFGSFEKVCRANWKGSNKYLTLKSFSNINNVTVKETVNELKLLYEMNFHENIIRFCGITIKNQDDNSKKYLLVMEYADSGTLRNYLKEHFDSLDWSNKLNIALQLASAVSYLHDKGIVHHNLHSNNVLVHQGIAKLTDFRLSKRSEELSNIQSKLFDMIAYVDPKLIEQKRINNHQTQSYSLNKKSNIYSIGVLLWEISSGQPPFCNEPTDISNIGLDLRILQGLREKPVVNTPEDYIKIYTDCWNDEPNNRPIINEVIVKLKSIISNQLSSEQALNNLSHGIKLSQIIQNFIRINNKEIEPPMLLNEDDFSIVVDEIVVLIDNIEREREKQEVLNYLNYCNINSQEIYYWLLNNQTNSNSLVLLGDFSRLGIEINNKQKAFESYQKAANLDNPYGINGLANCYEDGIGTSFDKHKAFELYQKAADFGSASGINNLGYCYDIGIGTIINKQKAFELYKESANLGYRIAQYNLAFMYENEEDVKDINQAIYWYEKCAEQGDQDAQNKLAEIL